MKPDYKNFSVADFVHDDFFIKWVKGDEARYEWFWQSFVKENPSKSADIAEAKRIVSLFQFSGDELSRDARMAMKEHILLHIAKNVAISSEGADHRYTQRWGGRGPFFMKAAAVISLLIISFFVYRLSEDRWNFEWEAQRDNKTERLEQRANPKGQKSVLFLADGSKVWLNAESTLNYGKNFETSETRDVYLEGEAFFEVVRNTERPFVVHTSDIVIFVHGTSFNVKAYAADGKIETTLLKGKVSISKEGEGLTNSSLVLKPNQRAVFVREKRTINVEEVSAARAAQWREDRLVFDETPFYEVISQLERWYGTKIHVEKSDELDCTLTAYVEKESLVQVMELIADSQKITYSIKGNAVFIQGSLCR